MNPTRHHLVDSPEALECACESLSATVRAARPVLYLDTEFESSKRGTRLCLLQISAGAEIYLVDAIVLRSLSPLSALLKTPGLTWVLHAGMQDVKLISDELRVRPPEALFDTQIAWALLGPESSVSLAYVNYKVCGVRSAKGHQSDDWVRRPLPPSQLEYAASDVLYLPAIFGELEARAHALGRSGIVQQASHDNLNPERDPPSPLRMENFRNAWQLDREGQAALTFLIDWYNELPPEGRANAPESKTLLAVAARLPGSEDALGRIKGVSPGVVRRHGAELVRGLSRAGREAQGTDYVPLEPPPYASFEEIRLEAWLHQLRAEVCAQLGVAPELVLPSRLLKHMQAAALVEGPSAIATSLRGWRSELLAEAVDAFCKRVPPPL